MEDNMVANISYGYGKDYEAMTILAKYIRDNLDKSKPLPEIEVFIVWKSKILGNWKYLISTSLFDGMYYELTYNGETAEWYLDAYKKVENRVIPTKYTEQMKNSGYKPM